jgi:hypothetical protein
MNKTSIIVIIASSILGLFLATTANANLIVNGSFEDAPTGSSLGGNSSWTFYNASQVTGWDGDNIELWIGRKPNAYEGNYHAELNAHGSNKDNWSISQTFNTVAGSTYNVFFAYSARSGNSKSSKEVFSVSVDNANWTIDDHVKGTWKTFNGTFVADDTSATITFASVVPYWRTVGNFIDDIRVTNVPAPGALALLCLGLTSLCFARKAQR